MKQNVSAEARSDALEAQIAVSTDLPNRCEMMDLWDGEKCGDHAEVLAVLDSEVEDTPLNVWMCMSCLTQKSGSGVEIIDAPRNSRIRRSEDAE
jgi:hypothetical protein